MTSIFDGPNPPSTLEEVIGQAIGAGSVCWEGLSGAVFQSEQASAIVDDVVAWIRKNYEPKAEDPETILAEAERVVNGPRRVEYGGVRTSFERIAAKWSVTLGTEVTPELVALAMIDLKTVRAMQGFHRDSFVDIAGYARCVELMQGDDD